MSAFIENKFLIRDSIDKLMFPLSKETASVSGCISAICMTFVKVFCWVCLILPFQNIAS